MTLPHSRIARIPAALLASGIAGGAQAALVISKHPTANTACSGGVCTATSRNATLNVGDLANLLAASDVAVTTGSATHDIRIDAAFSWTSANRLTLDAARSVEFDRSVTVAGNGGLTIATNDGESSGDLSFAAKGNVAFWDLSSSLVIDGASYVLATDIATLASDIAAKPDGAFALARHYNAKSDGVYRSAPIPTTFTGRFEGLGNTIANLSIDDSDDSAVGLFAHVGAQGSLRDIALSTATVTSTTSQQGIGVGTLVGLNEGTIAHAQTAGIVSGPNVSFVGGLAGIDSGSIVSSHADVGVTAGNSAFAGGLAGSVTASGTILASSATGAVSGAFALQGGGLVGTNAGLIAQSFATGAVAAQSVGEKLGGLVGFDDGTIRDCYASGNAAVEVASYAGGLVGFYQPTGGASIATSYSLGAPSGGSDAFVGGFLGFDNSSGGGIGFAYWDTETSGIADPSRGAGNLANDPGIKGLSSGRLQKHLPQGFDAKTWSQNPAMNGGFPYLAANPPR
jgi:hypothetical protein